MILSAEWKDVATARSAGRLWVWKLDKSELIAFRKANAEGSVDAQILSCADGTRVMRARNKQAAAAVRLAKQLGRQ